MTSALPNAEVDKQFRVGLIAAGGALPYHWSIVSGTLPPGFSLGANTGILSGTTSQEGQFDISVQVSDSSGPNPQTAMKELTLSVVALALHITSGEMPSGQVGGFYQSVLSASGGVAPYAWSVTGALPAGLALKASSGAISGTPAQAGACSFTLQVTDAVEHAAQASLSVTIAPAVTTQPLAIATTKLPNGVIQSRYSTATMTATGGTAPYTWSLVGSLPPGMSLSGKGALGGTPTLGGQFSLTLKVTDSVARTSQKTFSLYIFPHPLDVYGGLREKPCPGGATAHFTTRKIIWHGSPRWILCTPSGNEYYHLGVELLTSPGSSVINNLYHGSLTEWAGAQLARIQSAGFNSCTDYAHYQMFNICPFILILKYAPMAMRNYANLARDPTHNLFSMTNFSYFNFSSRTFPDGSAPQWASYINAVFVQDYAGVNPFYSSPWLLGLEYDDRDDIFGMGAGSDLPAVSPHPHLGWVTLIDAPVQYVDINAILYTDPKNYSKYALQTALQTKYETIGALNTAWGSSYSAFGTTGVTQTNENIGTGTGSQLTFAFTLAHPKPAQYSMLIKVGGTAQASDYNAAFYGVGVAAGSGSINYTTGAGSITFAMAPSKGVAVTATYVQNGWGVGTGFLDEAGQNAWVCNAPTDLAGCSAAMVSDLDNLLDPLATAYAAPYSANIHARGPGVLQFGIPVLNSDGVTRAGLLAGLAKTVDVMTAQFSMSETSSTIQQQMDYCIAATGDMPYSTVEYVYSNADSPFSSKGACPADPACYRAQALKGAGYGRDALADFNLKGTTDGIYHIAGVRWWQYADNTSEQTGFGLTTASDNLYDGLETIAGRVCDWQGRLRGGEASSYGNVLGPVTSTNYQILSLLASDQP